MLFQDFTPNFLYKYFGMQSMRVYPHTQAWYEEYDSGTTAWFVLFWDFTLISFINFLVCRICGFTPTHRRGMRSMTRVWQLNLCFFRILLWISFINILVCRVCGFTPTHSAGIRSTSRVWQLNLCFFKILSPVSNFLILVCRVCGFTPTHRRGY